MNGIPQVAEALEAIESIAKSEASELTTQLTPLLVKMVLENVILDLSEEGKSKKVTIELEIPDRETVERALSVRSDALAKAVKDVSGSALSDCVKITLS